MFAYTVDSGHPEKAMDGYYVNCRVFYSSQQINFVNPRKGICKPLMKNGIFQDFPGSEPGEWSRYYGQELAPDSALRVDISPYDANGNTRVLITIQWADRGDDGYFGMDNDTPELTLFSMLDDEGNFLHPFRIHEISW